MARCAVINPNTNIVENVIVADPESDVPPEGTILVQSESAGPGWVWDGETFSDPTPPPPPPPPVVPEFITRRQCALQLFAMQIITLPEAVAMTKTDDMPAAIAQVFDGLPTPEAKMLAEIDFAAANYYRSNSLLGMMGLTEAQVDEFFLAAAQR